MNYFHKEFCRNVRVRILLLTATLLLIVAPRLTADEIEATLIWTIDTSTFPSPDPAGIVYISPEDSSIENGYFLISDSEVNEMPELFPVGQNMKEVSNVFMVSLGGELLDSFNTQAFSDEPTGITINPNNKHCFFSDDTGTIRYIYEIDPGEDSICLTGDDSLTKFPTLDFGASDIEDITYGLNSLFIADGAGNKVFRVMPGENGVFDGVPLSGGDDLVSNFDTQSLGLTDPEGLVFDPRTRSLFIVGDERDLIIQTSIDGLLLRNIDISSVHPKTPAGLALAPSSLDLSMTNLYLVARGYDNDEDPYENDGKIYEFEIPPLAATGNNPPVVSAGDDQSVLLPNNTYLSGIVSDDGIPDGTLTSTWSKLSGPQGVTFTTPSNAGTYVSFSMAGTYVLRLTGYDGELYSFDDLSIIVTDNSPPTTLNVPSEYPTIQDAFSNAVEGDIILLAPGTYEVNETLLIDKNNITIASRYLITGDENDIDSTIITGDESTYLIIGERGQSENLILIGLTLRGGYKAVLFQGYGEVHYCKFYDSASDAISWDFGGGAVTYTRVENPGDDAIDIDTAKDGSFLIAYNELMNSKDDLIEIHLYKNTSTVNMHYDIHDNIFSDARKDGIQLIDYIDNTNRTFDIYRNIFKGIGQAAFGAMFEVSVEDFQGAPMTERIRIYNNYFYNNDYHVTGGDNMIVLNNIFESAATTAVKRVKGSSIVDHNLFYNNPIDTLDTLTGSNNLYINPQRNSDFTLQQNSPAIDTGTPSYTHLAEVVLQIASDEYVGQNPDIGRYEYDLNDSEPVITLLGANPMNLYLGETFIDPGATALDAQDGNLTTSIQVISNVNTAIADTYTVTYSVIDNDGNSALAIRTVVVNNGTNSLQRRVSASEDDAEETQNGSLSLYSSDLEIGNYHELTQTVGVRFTNITIPVNAIITNAYIQFTVDEKTVDSANFVIHGESSANAPGFDTTSYNISGRIKTATSAFWEAAAWSTVGAAGEDQRTSDLTLIVQEIVSETGWSSGNAMAFILTGNGSRVAEAFDGDQAGAPLLYIEYTTEASTAAPVITLLGANPLNLNLGETFIDPGASALDAQDGNLTTSIQVNSNVNTAIAGIYMVTYSVIDNDGNSASVTRTVVVSNGTNALQRRVSTSADDAEEYADGNVYFKSSDLELVVNKSQQQIVGIRFTNLTIPVNATITKANIQFKVDEKNASSTLLTIHGESTANAPSFDNIRYNISDRTKTSASVTWVPEAWNTVGAVGEVQRTSDLISIVQEIVSETGWNSGNAMTFIFTGNGTRVAEAYDGDQAGAPLLNIEYTTSVGPTN